MVRCILDTPIYQLGSGFYPPYMTWLDGSKTFNSSALFFWPAFQKVESFCQAWEQIPQVGQIYDFPSRGLFKFLQSCG